MNIPQDVIEKATVAMYEARPLDLDQEDDEWTTLPDDWKDEWREGARVVAEVIAEWARAEALREAAEAVGSVVDAHYLVADKNLGHYRTEVTCACGESWWFGEHDGDPRAQEMWVNHRATALRALAEGTPERGN